MEGEEVDQLAIGGMGDDDAFGVGAADRRAGQRPDEGDVGDSAEGLGADAGQVAGDGVDIVAGTAQCGESVAGGVEGDGPGDDSAPDDSAAATDSNCR